MLKQRRWIIIALHFFKVNHFLSEEQTSQHDADVPEAPRRGLPKPAKILLLITLAVALSYWVYQRFTHVYTDDARIAANMITVSSQVSGQITELNVKQGDRVDKGAVIAVIDARKALLRQQEIEVEVRRLQANIERGQAELHLIEKQTGSQLQVANARHNAAVATLSAAESEKELMQGAWQRAQALKKRKLVSEQGWEAARSKQQRANEASKKAAAELATVDAQHREAQANLELIDVVKQELRAQQLSMEQKKIELERQNIELQDRTVLASSGGIIDKSFIDEGEYVVAGQRLLLLHDDQTVWIDANVKETEISRVKLGAEVDVIVDAYPDLDVKGKVERIGSSATSQYALLPNANPSGNFTKVTQRLPVRISIEQKDSLLRPGMMVEIVIAAK